MRRMIVGIWTCVLLIGIGTIVSAEEPSGSLWSRMFGRAKSAPEKKEPSEAELVLKPASESPERRRRQADADWHRREDVCQKLLEVAVNSKDSALERQAEQLHQRAFDIWVQQNGSSTGTSTSTTMAEKSLERQLKTDPTNLRSRLMQSSGTPVTRSAGLRASNGEEP